MPRDDLDTFVPLIQLNCYLAVEITPPQDEIRLILLKVPRTSRLTDFDEWFDRLFDSGAES
jgi:hypothetical protein